MKRQTKLFVIVMFLGLFMTCMTYLCRDFVKNLSRNNDRERYESLTDRIFRDHLLSNTLNMHFTIAHPKTFGITSYTPRLYSSGEGSSLEEMAEAENLLSSLDTLSVKELSENQCFSLSLLRNSLKNSMELDAFPYYSEPLSPASGTQMNLPILLAEYTFRNKRDVDDYLTLLSQTRDYFSDLLVFEQEKAAAGFFMSTESFKKVRAQCHSILTKEELNAGTHFLQTSFRTRIEELQKQEGLTDKEISSYLAENDRLLRTVLLPAYEDLSDGLFLLSDHAGSPKGLAEYPEGSDYYEALFRVKTGSYRSMEEVYTLLKDQLYRDAKAIDGLLKEYPESRNLLASGDDSFLSFHEPAQMLADLEHSMAPDFPELPGSSDLSKRSDLSKHSDLQEPSVSLKNVEPNMEAYSAPAFYLSSPMDAPFQNVIYLNQKFAPDNLELYTTLAHEGYPGHMYQNVYCNLKCMENEEWIRSTLWYGGYMEGWAVYVEFLAYDQAAKKLVKEGHQSEAACVLLAKHNRSLWLCLYTLADLMVHHEGADLESLKKLFSPFGLRSDEALVSIFQTIIENPCNYPMYYIGYLEILDLKEQARKLWKDSYSDLEFHRYLLDFGPSDFSNLRQVLETRYSSSIPKIVKNNDSQ